jgi:hypothetical protein
LALFVNKIRYPLMISNVQFWRNWPKTLKLAFFLFSIVVVCLLAMMTFWYFNGLENALHWDVATELNKKFIATEAFVEKGLRFTDNQLVYYLKEWYLPANEVINQNASWILLASIIIGLSLISSALSFQNSFWFLGALLSLAAFLILARTEIVFQSFNNTPFIIAFSALGGMLFLFNSFLNKTSFWFRFLSILGLFILLLYFAITFSKVNIPVLALANYGLLFAILCFAIFVYLISHEIMVALIWTVSNAAEKGKSSFLTYLGIGIIYILNCLLIYLENIRAIDDSFMVISPILLFISSTIIGLWGFKKQCEDIGFFSFQRTGVWVYLGLSIISTAVLGFAYATANDSLIELLNDYIAIAHLSLGLVFFVHVTINFIGLFQQGLDTYLVLYKPNFNKLFLAKIAAIFVMAFFLIQKNIYSYNQLQAGLNNAIGDYYLAEGDLAAAETYYKESVNFDFYNHKGNYALANMAKNVGDGVTAAYFYRQAIVKNPSEFAYVGLSQNLETEGLYFDALFSLREASAKFPKSAVLATNMAHLLEKANVRDSVYHYLNRANEICSNCGPEKVNLQAFWIENALAAKLDSVTSEVAQSKYTSNLANQLAISRMTGNVKGQMKGFPKNQAFNTTDFATLYNQITLPENTIKANDSLWNELLINEANITLNEDIRYLKALQSYQTDNKISGIKQLTYLSQDSTETGLMYRRILGLWYLQEGLFDKSREYLKLAGDGASAQVLMDNDFEGHLNLKQLQQAEELLQINLTEESYLGLYKKAPFNPYLLNDIASFLEENGKETEAYQMVFDALEFNEKSITLWRKYVHLAIINGVLDYAEKGLKRLSQLMKPAEYDSFIEDFKSEKEKMASQFK